MDRVFGLSLLYRHFPLSGDERLVEYHGTLVPWKVDDFKGRVEITQGRSNINLKFEDVFSL